MEEKDSINVVKETKKVMKRNKNFKFFVIIVIILLVITIPIVANFSANFYVKSKVSSVLDGMKGNCTISHERTDVNIFANSFDIYNLVISCNGEVVASAANIHFDGIAFNYPIVEKISAKVNGGMINVSSDFYGKYGEVLTKLSYSIISFNADIATTYDDIKKVFHVANSKLFVDNLGDIVIDFTVPNVADGDISKLLSQIGGHAYSDMWISFLDKGLARKVVSDYAKAVQTNEDAARARIVKGLDRRIHTKYKDNGDMREKLIALSRFIEKPTAIVLSFNPARKATLVDIIPTNIANNWKANIIILENYPLLINY